MAALELTCEVCNLPHTFNEREVQDLVTAFQQGGGDRLRCSNCGMSLARPLQRALHLVPVEAPLPAGSHIRRRHVRLPLDLPATYQQPGCAEGSGQVKNLSDGGLLLEAPEILPPATHLRLQLHTQQGVRPFEGEVRWNDAERRSNPPPIAHGIRFAGPGVRGLAVELFLGESQRPPPGK
jgi:PilZ domain-containing protein